MTFDTIGFDEGQALLDWNHMCAALTKAHTLPKAEITDTLLYRGNDTLLSRAAWIDGLGLATKAATIFPDNPVQGKPVVNGAVNLFSDVTGELDALIDFHLVTKWKTAGDSLLAAKHLARPNSRNILIVGAGTVGRSLREAYGAGFPDATFTVWNRTPKGAQKMAAEYPDTRATSDLEAAVMAADIITSATMATKPLIMGDWLQAGQHIDLIGAYRPDMREVDDTALQRARVFVDSRDTTINHIGELMMPIADGAITVNDVIADFYDLATGGFRRNDAREITLFKNGGGAHLDLMVSRYILETWRGR